MIQILNPSGEITDHPCMDRANHFQSYEARAGQVIETPIMVGPETPLPEAAPATTIESLLPIANANDLLRLIAQGHCPSDLNQLINNSSNAA